MSIKNTEVVVMSCCILHNYLRKARGVGTHPSVVLDEVGLSVGSGQLSATLSGLQRTYHRHPGQEAKEVREFFQQYINTFGAVDCQENSI